MIGSKGLSCCLWLFFLGVTATFFYQGFFFLAPVLGFFILKHWICDVPKARKESQKKGLETVVLLPVNYWVAQFLIKLSGKTVKKTNKKYQAYEIHIVLPDALQKAGIRQVITTIRKDLFLMRETTKGLFLWDTNMPIPKKVQVEIDKAVKNGTAFWENGGYPVPRFPGTQLELKGHKNKRAHGAIFFKEGDNF